MRAQPIGPRSVARRLRDGGWRPRDCRRGGDDAMLKTIIQPTACLTVSAAAFIAVTKLDANAAKSRSGSVPETSEPKSAPTKPAPSKPAPAPPAPKLTTASLVLPTEAAPSTKTATSKTDADATLTVPDWKGKRLSVVRREARKLGLHVAALDDTG